MFKHRVDVRGQRVTVVECGCQVCALAGRMKTNSQVQAIFVSGGWTGVHFRVAGTWDEAAKRALMHPESPEWNALICLGKAGIIKGAEAAPFNDVPTGSFQIEVAENSE